MPRDENETISDGLKRLGYTHRRDERTEADHKHVIEGNGHLSMRMRADEASELIRQTDEAAAGFVVMLPISDVQADIAGIPASILERAIRAVGTSLEAPADAALPDEFEPDPREERLRDAFNDGRAFQEEIEWRRRKE